MIKRFFNEIAEAFSSSDAVETSATDREAAIRKATAVLMLDVARADYVFEESEFARVLELVESHFGLSPEETVRLVNDADDEADIIVENQVLVELKTVER